MPEIQTNQSVNQIDRQRSFFVLMAAIFAVSSAAPLVKSLALAPLSIAFWRTLIVSVCLLLSLRKENLSISHKHVSLSILAGIFLAVHFWTWFQSLHLIGSLRSTTLVCLNPIWVGLIELILWKKMQPRYFWMGSFLALLGIGLMSYQEVDLYSGKIQGDILAIIGGILGAAYLIVGQKVRQSVDIQLYGFLVCASSAFCLGILSYALAVDLSVNTSNEIFLLFLLAIGPQFIGHIGLNYCLKSISAATISLSLLLEPVGASILSFLFTAETPTTLEISGSLIILLGVALGLKNNIPE